MKILVTGGAGFIGSHIVEQARAQGHEVAVLDNLSSGKRENVPAGVRLFEVDLRDRERTEQVLLEFKPEAVSHQAAQASVSISVKDPALDANVNIIGSIHLFDACEKYGVRRVVFASTGGAIYGEVPEGKRADESTPPVPISPYAISKLAVEHLLGFYRAERGLASTILRYANVYGPRQDAHGEAGVVAIFANRVLKAQPLCINARREQGDAGCVRDYTYVADVARANLLAFEGKLNHSVMNLGTGVTTTTEQLAKRIAGALGKQVALEYTQKRAGDLERSVLDPSRCQEALGELVSLDVGIQKTAAWYAEATQ